MPDTYAAVWIEDGFAPGDGISYAIDDTGHAVASWVSSSEGWARRDLPRALPEGTVLNWMPLDQAPPPCPGCDECKRDDDAG